MKNCAMGGLKRIDPVEVLRLVCGLPGDDRSVRLSLVGKVYLQLAQALSPQGYTRLPQRQHVDEMRRKVGELATLPGAVTAVDAARGRYEVARATRRNQLLWAGRGGVGLSAAAGTGAGSASQPAASTHVCAVDLLLQTSTCPASQYPCKHMHAARILHCRNGLLRLWLDYETSLFFAGEFTGTRLLPLPTELRALHDAASENADASADPQDALEEFRATLASIAPAAAVLTTMLASAMARLEVAHTAVPESPSDTLAVVRSTQVAARLLRTLEAATAAARSAGCTQDRPLVGGSLARSARSAAEVEVQDARYSSLALSRPLFSTASEAASEAATARAQVMAAASTALTLGTAGTGRGHFAHSKTRLQKATAGGAPGGRATSRGTDSTIRTLGMSAAAGAGRALEAMAAPWCALGIDERLWRMIVAAVDADDDTLAVRTDTHLTVD